MSEGKSFHIQRHGRRDVQQ